jgi:hypothetical protein
MKCILASNQQDVGELNQAAAASNGKRVERRTNSLSGLVATRLSKRQSNQK